MFLLEALHVLSEAPYILCDAPFVKGVGDLIVTLDTEVSIVDPRGAFKEAIKRKCTKKRKIITMKSLQNQLHMRDLIYLISGK